ncbi:MAG TPA: ATP-binding cassette domain-containing protein [Verrucomicrobiae bacterium]|jgi:phospholipid/cholesterol/gamma-HCH transport system ATP-binding protein|nr:ATP-binding cassette domain-containing protein [Verrucomicrobiae bacterium]
MNNPASHPEHSADQQGISVKVTGLRKSFAGHEILKGIDFEVQPGEVFVLMGPSGSGKSVLLKQIIGLDPSDSGEILIDGHPIQDAAAMDHYRTAMVFQSSALLNSLTVGENVGLYLSEHHLKNPGEIGRIVADKLKAVGLSGHEEKMPAELSGGMKKRVAIARALVIEPQLILYDEPTSELDPISAVAIGEEILRLKKHIGVTSIVVSHDRDLAFGVADRIAVINAGRIIATGTPAEICRNPDPLIQQFLNADFKTAIQKAKL